MSDLNLSVQIHQIDRIELIGDRHPDGTVECHGQTFKDWPAKMVLHATNVMSATYRLEETEEESERSGITPESENQPSVTTAWYVPDVD